MNKHPLPEQFEDYLINQLAPLDLLEFDDHLAQCEICRARLSAPAHLESLTDSFTGNFGKRSFLTNWYIFGERFSENARLIGTYANSIRKSANLRHYAGVAAIILIFTGAFFIYQNKKQSDFYAEKFQTEELQNSEIVMTAPNPLNNEKEIMTRETSKPTVTKSPTALNQKGLKKNEAVAANLTNTRPKNSEFSRKSFKIESLSEDESELLSAADQKNSTENLAHRLSFVHSGGIFKIFVSGGEKRDEYEFYLTELPKLSTVKREKSVKPEWRISEKNLIAGKSYILQVTVLRNGEAIGSLKKIINAEKTRTSRENIKQIRRQQ